MNADASVQRKWNSVDEGSAQWIIIALEAARLIARPFESTTPCAFPC